jgi:hypothetical protein
MVTKEDLYLCFECQTKVRSELNLAHEKKFDSTKGYPGEGPPNAPVKAPGWKEREAMFNELPDPITIKPQPAPEVKLPDEDPVVDHKLYLSSNIGLLPEEYAADHECYEAPAVDHKLHLTSNIGLLPEEYAVDHECYSPKSAPSSSEALEVAIPNGDSKYFQNEPQSDGAFSVDELKTIDELDAIDEEEVDNLELEVALGKATQEDIVKLKAQQAQNKSKILKKIRASKKIAKVHKNSLLVAMATNDSIAKELAAQECKFFKEKGHCKYGEKCKYLHIDGGQDPDPPPEKPPPPPPPEVKDNSYQGNLDATFKLSAMDWFCFPMYRVVRWAQVCELESWSSDERVLNHQQVDIVYDNPRAAEYEVTTQKVIVLPTDQTVAESLIIFFSVLGASALVYNLFRNSWNYRAPVPVKPIVTTDLINTACNHWGARWRNFRRQSPFPADKFFSYDFLAFIAGSTWNVGVDWLNYFTPLISPFCKKDNIPSLSFVKHPVGTMFSRNASSDYSDIIHIDTGLYGWKNDLLSFFSTVPALISTYWYLATHKAGSNGRTKCIETYKETYLMSEELTHQLVHTSITGRSKTNTFAAIVDRMADNYPQINIDRSAVDLKVGSKLYAKQFIQHGIGNQVENSIFYEAPVLTPQSTSMDITQQRNLERQISQLNQGPKLLSLALKELTSDDQSQSPSGQPSVPQPTRISTRLMYLLLFGVSISVSLVVYQKVTRKSNSFSFSTLMNTLKSGSHLFTMKEISSLMHGWKGPTILNGEEWS